MKNEHDILIIGGGTGGIMAASRFNRLMPELSIGLIEPADTHYYQPAWTLVGANTYNFEKTARPMASLIPEGVTWYKESAKSFDPDGNSVTTDEGNTYGYKYLIASPGIKIDPSLVEGLSETLGKNAVCSVYTDPKYVWEVFKNFKGGTALFTQPTTAIKCGGAPQKIMYLADDAFKQLGVRDKTHIAFATPGRVIFGLKNIAETLTKVVDRKNIQMSYGYRLVAVDGKEKIAWYEMADHESYYNTNENVKIIEDGNRKGIRFDMLHLAPPQTAPDFISDSPLSNEAGWLSVDQYSMQHTKYANIFGVGDACGLPTAKTGAAIRKQIPVVVANIQKLMAGEALSDKKYNGYSSCPLVTGYGKMVLAEFDYDNNFTPDPQLKQMLVFNSDKEHWRLWILKKYILPYLYWNKMMKGKEV